MISLYSFVADNLHGIGRLSDRLFSYLRVNNLLAFSLL